MGSHLQNIPYMVYFNCYGAESDTLKWYFEYTVEPRYNEVLGTMKITLLYQVSHYIRVKKNIYKEVGPAELPCYKRVLL